MEPAAERLRPALAAWEPGPPDPPFLSTTTCALEPPARMREVLLAQLTSPVRFGDAVAAALDAGAERFVEVGHGRVLSALVRRVRRDAEVAQVGRARRRRGDRRLMPVALVTGASRGIGAACARALAADGFDVGVGYASDADGAAATAAAVEAAGRRAHAHAADVADEEQAAGLVEAVEEALGPLDALVLNAGITRDGLAVRMSADDWAAVDRHQPHRRVLHRPPGAARHAPPPRRGASSRCRRWSG